MYSYADRLRAVELYIKLGKRVDLSGSGISLGHLTARPVPL